MSALVEVTGVNSAVEHLQELGDRMSHDFGFGDNDVNNIDKVIEALRELEVLRHNAHDRLEAETIRASIKRHKLQFLPQQISKEITDAISSARQSNADALAHLKQQLENINKNIVYLEEYQKSLDEENAVLHPERELIRQQHEEIISQLNQRMAEKASMQIQLNETRDKVRLTNQEIVDLEDGILQLKEDLIQERGEARSEKRQLKKAVANTSDKTKEQKLLNVEKKKELDSLHEKLVDSEGKLDALRKSLRRYETSKAKLEGQERALMSQLQKQLKQNEELRRKGASIINEDLKLQKEFTENEKQLTKKLKRLENEIEKETSNFDEYDQKRTDYAEDLEQQMVIRMNDADRVAALDEQLQAEKRSLSMKAQEVGQMQGENIDMQEQIELLGESHKAMETELQHRRSIRTPTPPGLTEEQRAILDAADEDERAAVLAQLNKQIEDYREQLSRERKDRMDVQQRKNSVSKELEDYKADNQKFMQDMNHTITNGKQEHISLSNEEDEELSSIIGENVPMSSDGEEPITPGRGAQLQRELREDENEIRDLEEQLEREQKRYQEAFSRKQNEVDTMEREIIDMENGIAEKKNKIEEITPGFEELEKQFEERTASYESQKKNIVALKTKKSQLEDQLRKGKAEKEKMTGPQAKLRTDLKHKRHEAMFQIKHHGEQTKGLESEIYIAGCKLKTVMDENHRFDEACKKLSEDIDDIQNSMDYNEVLKARLLEEILNTKEKLGESWSDDFQIQQDFAVRDQETVDELGHLLDRTEKREKKISEITGHLEVELGHLTKFLDNLASRRPKDTYMSQCRTPTPSTPDSREGRRPLSRDGRLSRGSTRSQVLIEAVAEANRIESRKSSARVSRPQTSRSARSVVISEEVMEISSDSKSVTKTPVKDTSDI